MTPRGGRDGGPRAKSISGRLLSPGYADAAKIAQNAGPSHDRCTRSPDALRPQSEEWLHTIHINDLLRLSG